MGAWKKCALSAGKPQVRKIPRLGGGYFGFWGGGGSADFIFMGAGIFLQIYSIFSALKGQKLEFSSTSTTIKLCSQVL